MQENTAKTATEWVFVARSVGQLPDGQDQALRCMARAGVLAQSVEDWIAVAKAWAQDFDDAGMARQCVAKAKSIAKNSADWNQIADIEEKIVYYSQDINYRSEFSETNPPTGNYVVPNAAVLANADKRSMEWVSDAAEQLYTYRNTQQAIQYMRQAEATAVNSMDWTYVAINWLQDYSATDNAYQCMTRAESTAEFSFDWSFIASIWKDYFYNQPNAVRCMEQAEASAVISKEWEEIANFWKVLGDDERSGFALRKAGYSGGSRSF